MSKWEKWKKPSEDKFQSKARYEQYLDKVRCGICHERLKDGEEFELRAIQTLEERIKYNDSKYTSLAVIGHRKCIERG